MNEIKAVKEKVLKELEPSKKTEERIKKLKKKLMERIEEKGYEAVAVGSSSRGTYLPEDVDIDVFFYMPKETSREELEEKGVEIGKEVLKDYSPETHYAEHPYVKAETDGIELEVVPCYKMKGEITSAVDRSPLHHEYLKGRLKEKHKLEVKVLKKFLRNMKCYGAKEEVQGFSGFLCELLILNYGSFEEVLKAGTHWDYGEKIDIENHGKEEFKEPLVVIDPVDPERNAAAALSEEKLGRFIVHAKKFLKKPNMKNFEAKIKINKELLKGKNLLLITIPYPKDTVSEIGWSQLRRIEESLSKMLQEKEFGVYKSLHWTDEKKKACILLDLVNMELPKHRKHRGPPFYVGKHVEKFMEENKNIFINKNRLYSWKKRKEAKAIETVEKFFEDKDRLPSHYTKSMNKIKITTNPKKITKNKEVVKEYFRI